MDVLRSKPWIISLIIFAVLALGASRMHDLWGDEAETALFGRAVLKYGVPKGWDGTNIMGIGNASVLNSSLMNHSSPPLQYYLAAASFALFGESTFSARLPFLLISLLSIPLVWLVAHELTKDKIVAFFAAILTALCTQWILFAYQARYYSVTTVAGLLLVLSALKLKHWKWDVVFVASGLLFFYANYVSFAAWWVAVLVYLCAVKKNIVRFLLMSVVIAAGTLPWFLSMEPLASRGAIVFSPDMFKLFLQYGVEGWRSFHTSGVMPLWMILLVLFKPTLFIFLPIVYMTVMTVLTVLAQVDTVFVAARYTTVVIPFLCILAAYVQAHLYRWNRWAGIAVFVLYVFVNGNFPKLIKEIFHPYPTPAKAVAEYLKTNAKKGDTAFVSLDRDHEPLLFFLGDQVKFVNRVSLINSRIFPKNRGIIPRYIYDFRDEPDWVILMGKRGMDGSFLTFDFRPLDPGINLERDYSQYVIPMFFSDMSRPEIDKRSFVETPATPIDFVYIYKKKNLK